MAHATGTSATTLSHNGALLVATKCLRQHGLPNLPDPIIVSSGPAKGQEVLDKPALLGYPEAVVSQALTACRTLLEQAGMRTGGGGANQVSPQEMQDLLAFARCVRHHGIANFPDPNSQGGFDLAGTGINSHDLTPAELAAGRACLPAAHGAVHIPPQGTGSSQ